jgi:hypothetical protein
VFGTVGKARCQPSKPDSWQLRAFYGVFGLKKRNGKGTDAPPFRLLFLMPLWW